MTASSINDTGQIVKLHIEEWNKPKTSHLLQKSTPNK